MHLRTLSLSFVVLLLGFGACLAQQPTGPATLENLLLSDKAQKPAAAGVGPKRFVGTVVRPQDGVKHPDLDKGWAVYDAAAAKAAESIKADIAKQFDAAAAKGDLDSAEKWQAMLEKFEKTRELPTEKEAKTAVSAAVADYKKAKDELSKAYQAVVTALTMEKKIAEAKAVREESRSLSKASDAVANKEQPVTEQGDTKTASIHPKYKHFRLVALNSNTNGWEAYYRTIEFYDADTGKLIKDGQTKGTGQGAANAFDDDRETKYRTVPAPGVAKDWITCTLPKAVSLGRVRVIQWGQDCNHVFQFEIQGSSDGVKWTPIMIAKGVPFEFDSANESVDAEWVSP